MNNDLFRGKDGEKTVSPEQLDDYIHVSNPSAWIVLAAFAVLLVGICIWGVFGRLDTTIPVVAVRENDSIVCCIGEADREKVAVGMIVAINGEEFLITDIERTPVPVEGSLTEYAKHIGGLTDGEWIYCACTDCPPGLEGDAFPAEIIVERVNPLYFVTN